MLDADLSNILAELLKANYFEGCTTCIDAIQNIFTSAPMGYGEQSFYEYKLMRFMEAVALGLKPGTLWDGMEEANAGYIIVKDNGEVLAYYLYDRNTFRQYLLSNTKFEHGSASRHNFASIYKQNGHYYINLNLQIRYIQ